MILKELSGWAINYNFFFLNRQLSAIIEPSDVIITNVSNNENGSVQFISYVQLPGGMQVLTGEAYRAAIEVNKVEHSHVGM